MELRELSLGSNECDKSWCNICSPSESDQPQPDFNIPSKRRKLFPDHDYLPINAGPQFQTSVDLQVKDPLPLHWEQCLDLHSGRMCYTNRKTLKKTWNWPKDEKLELELSIPHQYSSRSSGKSTSVEEPNDKQHCSGTNMVALPCLNCHLLVILSKSSPACPNCKYVHSLPTVQAPSPKVSAIKSLNTLSLLN